MYERAKDGEPLSVAVLGVTSLQHRAQLLVDLCLKLKMSKRDDEIQPRVCIYSMYVVVQRGGGGGVGSYLWSVQEESHSPVQPGCSGLGPPDQKIYSCHVDMLVCQDLETSTWHPGL